MSVPVRIELVGEPKGKGRPRFSRKSGVPYTPGATRSYEAALRYAAQEAMTGRTPFEGPLSLTVQVHVPIPKSWPKRRRAEAVAGWLRPITRPDFDNYLKTMDALKEVVWRDDSQVVTQSFDKHYSERPRLLVTVAPWGPLYDFG